MVYGKIKRLDCSIKTIAQKLNKAGYFPPQPVSVSALAGKTSYSTVLCYRTAVEEGKKIVCFKLYSYAEVWYITSVLLTW